RSGLASCGRGQECALADQRAPIRSAAHPRGVRGGPPPQPPAVGFLDPSQCSSPPWDLEVIKDFVTAVPILAEPSRGSLIPGSIPPRVLFPSPDSVIDHGWG